MTPTSTIQSTIPWPENEPTVALYPVAAKAFDMGRSAAYASARAGKFPVAVIACGGKLRVPTAELRRVLGLAMSPVPAPAVGGAHDAL